VLGGGEGRGLDAFLDIKRGDPVDAFLDACNLVLTLAFFK